MTEAPRVVAIRGYDDVLAALEHPDLIVPGTIRTVPANALAASSRQTLGPLDSEPLRDSLERSATLFVEQLPSNAAVDLIADFAAPWSIELAMIAARLPTGESARLNDLARVIFLAAARSTDGRVTPEARDATARLAAALGSIGESSLDVQAFVALSQTLPCFLGAAWHALLANPEQTRWLAERAVTNAAVDELLRFAGPSRAVFREAVSDVHIGSVTIGVGDVAALMLADANHDEARFPNANQLDLSRDASDHLAFGHRPHACVGAAITRTATTIATRAVLPRLVDASLTRIEWLDGFAIRGPSSLVVMLPQNS